MPNYPEGSTKNQQRGWNEDNTQPGCYHFQFICRYLLLAQIILTSSQTWFLFYLNVLPIVRSICISDIRDSFDDLWTLIVDLITINHRILSKLLHKVTSWILSGTSLSLIVSKQLHCLSMWVYGRLLYIVCLHFKLQVTLSSPCSCRLLLL